MQTSTSQKQYRRLHKAYELDKNGYDEVKKEKLIAK